MLLYPPQISRGGGNRNCGDTVSSNRTTGGTVPADGNRIYTVMRQGLYIIKTKAELMGVGRLGDSLQKKTVRTVIRISTNSLSESHLHSLQVMSYTVTHPSLTFQGLRPVPNFSTTLKPYNLRNNCVTITKKNTQTNKQICWPSGGGRGGWQPVRKADNPI